MRTHTKCLMLASAVLLALGCPEVPPEGDTSARFDPMPDGNETEFLDGFVTRSRWNKDSLTFFLDTTTQDMSVASQRQIMAAALDVWRQVVPLEFTEVNSAANADMIIGFGTQSHCDLYSTSLGGDQCILESSFDGPSGVLAHCYFPGQGAISGDCHFDDAETYTDDNTSRTAVRLLEVAIHEFGHGLGLDHSDDPNAIMFPSYDGNAIKLSLGADDIAGIQSLYGSRDGTVTPRQAPMPDFPDEMPMPMNPNAPQPGIDSDGDMLEDDVELYFVGTDPNNPDTDGDMLIDYEVAFGLNPLNRDTDGDGTDDYTEIDMGRDPLIPDFGNPNAGPSPFVGVYFGQDFAGSGIGLEIFEDGSVVGVLEYLQFGFLNQVPLFGFVDNDGFMVMASADYFFAFEGIIANGSIEGDLFTAGGAFGPWFADFAGTKAAGKSANDMMAPDGDANAYQPVPAKTSARQHPMHTKVEWRGAHNHR